MNYSQLTADVTFLTGVNTTDYSAALREVNINSWYHKIVALILDSQDAWDFDDSNHSNFPILTTDLIANQETYILPAKCLKVSRLEISYDGVNWYKCEPFDINERGLGTSASQINADFVPTKPKYDLNSGAIFLYPIPTTAVTDGLKIWIFREVEEFSSATTKEPGFDEPFHRMLSIGAAMDWAMAKNDTPKFNMLTAMMADYEKRLRRFYGRKDVDRIPGLKYAYTSYE